MNRRRLASPTGLTALLAGAGVSHFLTPEFYDAIVPHRLPGSPRFWTVTSGIAELGCAVLVAAPRTRRTGAYLAAALFVAVFPANIQMALDWRDRDTGPARLAYGRLPLQLPLVAWALRAAADAALSES